MEADVSFENYKYMYNLNSTHTPNMQPPNEYDTIYQEQLFQNDSAYHESTNLPTPESDAISGWSLNGESSVLNRPQSYMQMSQEEEYLPFIASSNTNKYGQSFMPDVNQMDKKQKGI